MGIWKEHQQRQKKKRVVLAVGKRRKSRCRHGSLVVSPGQERKSGRMGDDVVTLVLYSSYTIGYINKG
ncbi:hypothetical protein RUM43_013590 [Polyplax serrata]|uniref:Uncharacterized protein n=1 Tax=Polyplax serrata TaxID=468196 RepID=A0AAN8S2S9_POLSC